MELVRTRLRVREPPHVPPTDMVNRFWDGPRGAAPVANAGVVILIWSNGPNGVCRRAFWSLPHPPYERGLGNPQGPASGLARRWATIPKRLTTYKKLLHENIGWSLGKPEKTRRYSDAKAARFGENEQTYSKNRYIYMYIKFTFLIFRRS